MKTKTISCPCCAIDLKTPLRGGPKTIICPVCKMRVEDPDGVEPPPIQVYPDKPKPNRRPSPAVIRAIQGKSGRKRSSPILKGLYVCWLLLCLVGNALTSFTLGFSLMYHRLPFYHPNGLVAGLLLISIPCILGIFLRRKWGVYGFCAANLLSSLLLFPSKYEEVAFVGFLLAAGAVVFIGLLNAGESPPASRIFPARAKGIEA